MSDNKILDKKLSFWLWGESLPSSSVPCAVKCECEISIQHAGKIN